MLPSLLSHIRQTYLYRNASHCEKTSEVDRNKKGKAVMSGVFPAFSSPILSIQRATFFSECVFPFALFCG